jgi:AcrR family transcriptional regulator
MSKTKDIEKKEKKRKSIMQAALKIFSKKGYSPAVLDEVAQEAGIAKGTLYLYFKDKEDLFYSTLMSVIDNLAELLEERISEDLDPIEVLEMISLIQIQYFSQNREFFNIYLTILNYNLLSNYTRLFESMLERKKALYAFEAEIVEQGKKQGLIRNDIATEDIVIGFNGLIESTIEQIFHENDQVTYNPEEKTKAIMRIFIEGCGGR